MNHKITITVAGVCASGKSTIARAIVDALGTLGFNVTNDDIDVKLGCEHPIDIHDSILATLPQSAHAPFISVVTQNLHFEPQVIETTDTSELGANPQAI
jgi:ABC-type cobalamin/Fe3+-siderophores transport system ATPase subunit